MATTRRRLFFALPLLFATACASATDRFNDGLELQAQGRYMEAAYRYADAVERDSSLQEARDRLLIVGDSAIMIALEEADYLDGRREPVGAARQFQAIDRLMSRVRSVGMRLLEPDGYRVARRTAFERAIGWYMVEGEDASREGTMGGCHSSVRFRAGRLLAVAGPEGGLSRRANTCHHRLGPGRAGGP